MTKKKDKNKTLIGLIILSETSKAVYYWDRKKQYAEVFIGNTERRVGMKVPLDDQSIGIKDGKIVLLNGLQWIVLKEIHIANATVAPAKKTAK